jgi:hypothetical protein
VNADSRLLFIQNKYLNDPSNKYCIGRFRNATSRARITGAPASAQGTFLFRQLQHGFAVIQIGHFDRGWV